MASQCPFAFAPPENLNTSSTRLVNRGAANASSAVIALSERTNGVFDKLIKDRERAQVLAKRSTSYLQTYSPKWFYAPESHNVYK